LVDEQSGWITVVAQFGDHIIQVNGRADEALLHDVLLATVNTLHGAASD